LGVVGFDPLEDARELFDVARFEPFEEVRADRREVGGGGELELGASAVGDGDLGGARVGRAAPSLHASFASEVDSDPGDLAGAEANQLGEVADADRASSARVICISASNALSGMLCSASIRVSSARRSAS
jgi:hypothetical protein